MKQLAIIPCGRKKIWDIDSTKGPTEVKDAYISVLHRLCEQYAEMFCNQWVVLSAKHGYLLPHDIVPDNYDLTFGMKKELSVITEEELLVQIEQKGLMNYDQVIALTGKKYQPIIENTFGTDIKIHYPLLGTKGIGEMQQRLKYAIEKNISLH
ncbi:hypothetical protein GCM10011351_02260 [Paraliobacillus quinghaiensis]|uniref:DUF6884 domain-containing protein n=1 Tax=Paraliobacillus quinghaiensis TaxID=470815 RepID=A0A917WQ06_9BACI|nr:DUF6884 domain-containing protein [Paraliobacillus quinghaiensis]GGM19967.1 hypothetical protein GCM10011351_02260 [Paraliobacillus quinghaiensis]